MLYLKALHIIFVVTWFAGLFYIVRLFVYHAEAKEKLEPERSILINHFKGAQKRLWYGITWPSLFGTYIFGISTWDTFYNYALPDWLILKYGFVLLLTVYQLICHLMFLKFQKDDFNFSGMQMRVWNEVATIFLIVIVFIVSMKDLSGWIYGLIGMTIFSIVLMLAIRIYKRIREKN